MRITHWRSCIALALLIALPASAHHSMSALFDFNERFTRTGKVTKLDWTNPHIYVYVEAPGEQNQLETWAFEGPSPVYFRRRHNIGKNDFQDAVGKPVTVDASRARDGSRSGLIRMITLPDGKTIPLCPDNC